MQSPDKLATYTNQLQQLFPDADQAFLSRKLREQSSDHVANAANALLSSPDYPRVQKGGAPPTDQQSIRPGVASAVSSGRSVASPPTPPRVSAAPGLSSSKSEKGLFDTLRRLGRSPSQPRVGEVEAPTSRPGAGAAAPPQIPDHMRPSSGTSSPGPTPTSSSAIRDNVRKAIAVSNS